MTSVIKRKSGKCQKTITIKQQKNICEKVCRACNQLVRFNRLNTINDTINKTMHFAKHPALCPFQFPPDITRIASRFEKYDAPRMFRGKKEGQRGTNALGISDEQCLAECTVPISPPSKRMHERAARRRLDIQGGGRKLVHPPRGYLRSIPLAPFFAGLEELRAAHILVSNSCMRSCKKGDKWKNS